MNYTYEQIENLKRIIVDFVATNQGAITTRWKSWNRHAEYIRKRAIKFENIEAIIGFEPEKYKHSSSIDRIRTHVLFKDPTYDRRIVRKTVKQLAKERILERVIGGGYRVKNG